jgi:hypothetical protein
MQGSMPIPKGKNPHFLALPISPSIAFLIEWDQGAIGNIMAGFQNQTFVLIPDLKDKATFQKLSSMLQNGYSFILIVIIVIILLIIIILLPTPSVMITPRLQHQRSRRLRKMSIEKPIDFLLQVAVTEDGRESPGQDSGS